ncbi:hypothetical protein [Dongia sp.]|uniref:hypothetical protein n=1 Tax=Dongia sp. TaxID=1977262 RepID=UPI0035B066FA
MRPPILALALLTLTACGYDSARPHGIDETVTAAISAEDETVIVLTVDDPLPVKSARLIDPSGAVTEAFAIDRDRQSYSGGGNVRPNVGVGVVGGSSGGVSTGIGIGFPLFSSDGGGAVRRMTQSRVQLRIPDIAAYRLGWQHYAIAVDLDDGVNRRSFQMVPPAPE